MSVILVKSVGGFAIAQAKGKYNARLSGEVYNAVIQWQNKHNLSIRTSDLGSPNCSLLLVDVFEDENDFDLMMA